MCAVDYRLDSTGCKGFSELCLYVYLHIYVCTNSQSFYRSNHLYVCIIIYMCVQSMTDWTVPDVGNLVSNVCLYLWIHACLHVCMYIYTYMYERIYNRSIHLLIYIQSIHVSNDLCTSIHNQYTVNLSISIYNQFIYLMIYICVQSITDWTVPDVRDSVSCYDAPEYDPEAERFSLIQKWSVSVMITGV